MREIPVDFQALLDSGATTLARCWIVTRKDGLRLGFTDHDRSITLADTSCEPDSGFTPSAVETGTGLAADTHDVSGVLSSDRIDAADIERGLFNGAEVEVHLVDWTNPESRVLLSRGLIGEIRRGASTFEAEITGISDRLSQPVGRSYLHSCACRLGDTKCGVDLGAPDLAGSGSIAAAVDPQQFDVTGIEAFANGWFTGGVLTWTSGANAGLDGHVKAHLSTSGTSTLDLWLAPPMAVVSGDTFVVAAGCDKTGTTCAAKFNNLLNFRGFPHMPGDDQAASYPTSGGAHDGGSLFR